jgi:hypothetical protein
MDARSRAPVADLKASFALEERQGFFQGDFMHQTKALHRAAQARRIPILRHVIKQEVRRFVVARKGHNASSPCNKYLIPAGHTSHRLMSYLDIALWEVQVRSRYFSSLVIRLSNEVHLLRRVINVSS